MCSGLVVAWGSDTVVAWGSGKLIFFLKLRHSFVGSRGGFRHPTHVIRNIEEVHLASIP